MVHVQGTLNPTVLTHKVNIPTLILCIFLSYVGLFVRINAGQSLNGHVYSGLSNN